MALRYINPVLKSTRAKSQPVVTCTPRQGLRALESVGLLSTVEAWVATQPRAAHIDFERATEWRRDWPLIEAARDALGMTSEAIDDLFALAKKL